MDPVIQTRRRALGGLLRGSLLVMVATGVASCRDVPFLSNLFHEEDEPAVERLLALTQLAWDYCWRTSPERLFAPMPDMLGAFQRKSYRHYSEATFAREFVPPVGTSTTTGAKAYRLDEPWLAVVELSEDRQTIRITVVDFSGAPDGRHYAAWRYSYATPRVGPNGGEVSGTESLEGSILGLDTRTSGPGTSYYDRVNKKRPQDETR